MRTTHYLRYMVRESRGSRGRLGFFVACLAVGVAAIVAVAGLSDGLESAVGREARKLLAADLVIEGRKPLPDEVVARLDEKPGVRRASIKEMVTVVAATSTARSQLAELKSVEGGYPFYGELGLEPARPLDELLGPDRTVVASDLLLRFELEVGDRLRIGQAEFEISGVVLSEPDRIGMALAMGPRVFVSGEGLARADLERFGSRITYRTLLGLASGNGAGSPSSSDFATAPASAAELLAFAEEIRGWPEIENRYRVETYAEVQPAVRDGLQRVERFLGLVALMSLLLGGVGVAQTTRAWLAGRMDAMAVLRSLGFRPREVFVLYFGQALALGLAGSVLGVATGVAVLALMPSLLAELLPEGLGVSLWQPFAFLRGLGLGLGTALLFSFAPLVAVRRVPPLRVLRKDVEPIAPSRWASAVTFLILVVGIALTATVQAASVRYGLGFAAGLAVATGVLALAAAGGIRLLRGLQSMTGGRGPVWLRQGIAALARPGSGTVGAVVALGLGVLMLLGMALVQGGLTRQLSTVLPSGSPSSFLIDIQPDQWAGVQEILREGGAGEDGAGEDGFGAINSAPVVTARFARIGNVVVSDLVENEEKRGRRWALTREQRVTYLDELAPDNKVLEDDGSGELWGDPERWELSIEQEYAKDLGVEVGTEVELDVQGVPVEFTVTSIRTVDWGTFDLNFFLVAEPEALVEAPQYRVATVRLPDGTEQAVQDRLAAAYPNVTLLKIRDVLARVRHVLDRLALGVQFLGGFTVLAGLVILSGAVSASSIRRSREIALLKTLGMVRREVALMFTIEFALLGLLAGAVGAVGGVLLSRTVLTRGMEIGWVFEPLPVAVAVLLSVFLAAAAAVLAGTRALTSRPLEVLRGG